MCAVCCSCAIHRGWCASAPHPPPIHPSAASPQAASTQPLPPATATPLKVPVWPRPQKLLPLSSAPASRPTPTPPAPYLFLGLLPPRRPALRASACPSRVLHPAHFICVFRRPPGHFALLLPLVLRALKLISLVPRPSGPAKTQGSSARAIVYVVHIVVHFSVNGGQVCVCVYVVASRCALVLVLCVRARSRRQLLCSYVYITGHTRRVCMHCASGRGVKHRSQLRSAEPDG
jgi:hypothetical protein